MIKITDKTVKQPFVFVDGEWRSVKKESVSVNGSWRTVWEKGYAVTVNYYDGNPKSYVITIGSVLTKVNTGGVVTGTEDTRENVTYYSCISAKVTYYKYSSKTLAYRSSK